MLEVDVRDRDQHRGERQLEQQVQVEAAQRPRGEAIAVSSSRPGSAARSARRSGRQRPRSAEPGEDRHVVVRRERLVAAAGSASAGLTSDSPRGSR